MAEAVFALASSGIATSRSKAEADRWGKVLEVVCSTLQVNYKMARAKLFEELNRHAQECVMRCSQAHTACAHVGDVKLSLFIDGDFYDLGLAMNLAFCLASSCSSVRSALFAFGAFVREKARLRFDKQSIALTPSDVALHAVS